MKFFSSEQVANSYKALQQCTDEKFWGVMAILSALPSTIEDNICYPIENRKVSEFLETTFRFGNRKNYSSNDYLYVQFSSYWAKEVVNQFIKTKPNALDLAVWAFRTTSFEDEVDNRLLLQKFINTFHLKKEHLLQFAEIKDKDIDYSKIPYRESELLSKLNILGGGTKTTLKMNGTLVEANAGELSRGPFIQPLYAALSTANCLLISQVDLTEYYHKEMKSKNQMGNILDMHKQQIFYGAPGTGKSHTVELVCKQYKHHRTTFHPDSDYSTFVGCYKPTMEKAGKKLNMNLSVQDLAIALNGYYNDASLGNVGGLQKFVYENYKYLNGDIMATNINQLLQLAGVSTNYAVEVNKYIKFCKLLPKVEESKITYSFVPQTFIQAYTEAWQYPNEPVFLVIEEINRGNCAQIFGDIFQLLDRNDEGWSSYAIDADKDLQGYLCDYFAENGISENAPEDIKSGKKLLLPPNLHIWATMNTSDQSLFPIDSAFKRRWDWKYVPIDEEKENWSIEVNGTLYSWSSFLKIINEKIYTKTNSEDKQLGFYFCKAKDDIISADKFVSKVLFYIYNDIFKDYGFDEDFFKDDEDNKTLSFRKYYDRSGNVNEVKVEKFLMNLGIEVAGVKEVEEDEEEELVEEDEYGNIIPSTNSQRDRSRFSLNGKGSFLKGPLAKEALQTYVDTHSDKTATEVYNEWKSLGLKMPSNFIQTEEEYNDFKSRSRDAEGRKRSNRVEWGNGNVLYISTQWSINSITLFMERVNAKNWGINISKV